MMMICPRYTSVRGFCCNVSSKSYLTHLTRFKNLNSDTSFENKNHEHVVHSRQLIYLLRIARYYGVDSNSHQHYELSRNNNKGHRVR